jgi:hypothetical protein
MNAERELFFGRKLVINEIVRGALAAQPLSFALVGPRLSGKSTLLHWLATAADLWPSSADSEQTCSPLIILVDCTWVRPAELFAQVLNRLAAHPSLEGRESTATGNATDSFLSLWQLTQQLHSTHQRLVLLLDNFDALDPAAAVKLDLHTALHRLTAVSTLVLATSQPLVDLGATGDVMPLGAVTQLFLGPLECAAAQQWLATYPPRYPGLAALADELLTLSGRHPYLLHKVGHSLAEVQQMLAPGQHLASHHLPLIRLRLAEHARPLFLALWQQLDVQPSPLQPALYSLLDRLARVPLPVEQTQRDDTHALNWLINQALISYAEQKDSAVYQLFSPLFADFVMQRRPAALSQAIQPQPMPPLPGSEQFYEQLSKMEAALLRYFEQHSQRLVTMDQLLAEVWKRPASSTRRVQEAIRRLRLQLEQQTPPIGIIENERGRGYRFVPAH